MKPDKKQEKEDLQSQQEQTDQQEQIETQPAVSQEAQEELTLEQELEAQLKREQDNYLRLAAEYDNFRKRSQKERDNLYTEIRAEIVGKFLPVYDNLERALLVETSDEAYKLSLIHIYPGIQAGAEIGAFLQLLKQGSVVIYILLVL